MLEVDGGTTVFINGQEAGAQEKKRVPFEIDVMRHVQPGKNVIAIRVDHRAIIELFLGGLFGQLC